MSQRRHHSAVNGDTFTKEFYNKYVLNMSEANTARTHQRVAAVLEMLGNFRGRLLTIGAGNLVEPLLFKNADFSVTIVDIANTQFERARASGLEAYMANIEYDLLPGTYDVVCCLEVLEHLINPLDALRNITTCVAPGGRLFVSLPDEFHIIARLQILTGRPSFSHYNWPHLRFFNLSSAHELFSSAGFEIVEMRHMPLAPPRAKQLQTVGHILANYFPRLFAISHVYELRSVS